MVVFGGIVIANQPYSERLDNMKYLIYALFLITVSCGEQNKEVDPELQIYVQNIEEKAIRYTGVHLDLKLRIQLSEFPEDAAEVGICSGDKKTISISRKYFEQFSHLEELIEAVILHEIGHCLYGLEHSIETEKYIDGFDNTRPVSVMYPNANIVAMHLFGNEEYYYNDLIKFYYF